MNKKNMDIKRAIGMSVLAYIASLLVGIVVAITFDINLSETQEIPPLMWYTGALASVLFAGGFAFWYFRSPTITPSAKAGLHFGLVMIATGFVLDFVTFLPLFTHENPLEPILEYYMAPIFWITILLVLTVTALTGKYLTSKEVLDQREGQQ